MRSSSPWTRELSKFIALYVYWQLSEAVNGPFVTKEAIASMLNERGLLAVEGRITLLRRLVAADNGSCCTFVLNGA